MATTDPLLPYYHPFEFNSLYYRSFEWDHGHLFELCILLESGGAGLIWVSGLCLQWLRHAFARQWALRQNCPLAWTETPRTTQACGVHTARVNSIPMQSNGRPGPGPAQDATRDASSVTQA